LRPLLKHALIRILLVADEPGKFGERIITALGRWRGPLQSTFKLIKIDHRALLGDGLTHTSTSKCGARDIVVAA
jgi:hypothetical protein